MLRTCRTRQDISDNCSCTLVVRPISIWKIKGGVYILAFKVELTLVSVQITVLCDRRSEESTINWKIKLGNEEYWIKISFETFDVCSFKPRLNQNDKLIWFALELLGILYRVCTKVWTKTANYCYKSLESQEQKILVGIIVEVIRSKVCFNFGRIQI